MKAAIISAVLLTTVWLQAGLLPAWRPLGVVPSLMLVVAYILLALWPDTRTLAFIIAAGFLLDLMAGSDFGLRTAFYTVFGLSLLALRQTGLELSQLEWGALITLAGTLVYEAALVASLALGHISLIPGVLARTVGATIVVNLSLFMIIWLATRRNFRYSRHEPRLARGL